jgi:hypothetical protein
MFRCQLVPNINTVNYGVYPRIHVTGLQRSFDIGTSSHEFPRRQQIDRGEYAVLRSKTLCAAAFSQSRRSFPALPRLIHPFILE